MDGRGHYQNERNLGGVQASAVKRYKVVEVSKTYTKNSATYFIDRAVPVW